MMRTITKILYLTIFTLSVLGAQAQCDVAAYADLSGPCATAVCGYDSYCCNTSWDNVCAGEAASDASCQYCWSNCHDNDLDGFTNCDGDCDDFNDAVNPNGVDVCGNGIDENCNGIVDDGSCDVAGYNELSSPCAVSVCGYDSFCCNNTWDLQCASEAASDPNCQYCWCDCYDNDLDGFTNCDGDCDDFNVDIYPGAFEICSDGIDNDCDGTIDVTSGTCDAVGYSDFAGPCASALCSYDPFCCSTTWDDICAGEATAEASCAYCLCGCYDNDLDGYTNCDGDCDDFNPDIHPGATEICNLTDDDCDGIVDNGASVQAYFSDNDFDGYGEIYLGDFCDAPFATSTLSGDCNDGDPSVNPGAIEDCGNGIDNDCDGGIDNVIGACDQPFYSDMASPCAVSVCSYDSYCCSNTWDLQCASEAASDENCQSCWCSCYDNDLDGYTNCDGDCNDFNPDINPGATEICNLEDDDCDGIIDNGASAQPYFSDNDFDGYGEIYLGDFCDPLFGASTLSGDCNDFDPTINPGAMEDCGNGIDNDCDGTIDNAPGACDQAGYSDLASPCATAVCFYDSFCCNNAWDFQCASEAASDENCQFCWCGCYDNDLDGYTNCDGDCNDFNPDINPGAIEICNLEDDDCDGIIDNGAGVQSYFSDYDFDGYGEIYLGDFCDAPFATSTLSGDCNDADPAINPGASEICDNLIDDDCDGSIDNVTGACDQADYTDLASPCGVSVCSYDAYCCNTAWDNICVGEATSDANCSFCWCGCYDNDLDGYTNCDGDCDDFNDVVYPSAPELCNGLDENCNGIVDENVVSQDYYLDADGDGYGYDYLGNFCDVPVGGVLLSGDCDDTNMNINPGMDDICGNGIDEDCSGIVDDAAGSCDIAGYSDLASPCAVSVCGYDSYCCNNGWDNVCAGEAASDANCSYCVCNCYDNDLDGFTNCDGDCDDFDASVNPNGVEICSNGIDEDCDGLVDNVTGSCDVYGYSDLASPCATSVCSYDSYCCNVTWDNICAGEASSDISCTACICGCYDNDLDGFTNCDGDCDDFNDAINPGMAEICNGIDEDCNGLIDDNAPLLTYYADEDGDGYGEVLLGQFCFAPSNSSTNDLDCDDADANINPSATEVCNGLDDDCDGAIDDNAGNTFYADTDGDGYGDLNNTILSCNPVAGYSTNNTDCDDTDSSVHPNATETCNQVDDDCDGLIDDGIPTFTFYADIDGDGFGGSSLGQFCSPPVGSVTSSTDCDDTDAAIHPSATESCNGQDDNCNGQVDEGLTLTIYYADADGDGYGNASLGASCAQPANSSLVSGDCNDANNLIYPGANESCNTIDDNCNGQIDDNVVYQDYFIDLDGDGFGDSFIGNLCVAPANSSTVDGDCDDTNPDKNPDAIESCNSSDDNCNGQIDEGIALTAYYADVDGDSYGSTLLGSYCSQPVNSSSNNSDCDDTDPGIHPNAPEFCNSQDDNCNGQVDEGLVTNVFYADIDGDGYGGSSLGSFCFPPVGSVTSTGDCNDNNSSINPNATEACNSLDDNCDGNVDEFLLNAFYADVDQDGYGDAAAMVMACSEPAGYVTSSGDCNDNAAAVHPGAIEYCNSIDDDCNDQVDDNCIDSVDELEGGWNVQLYPNPVSDQLAVTLLGTVGNVDYIIYDAVGKIVLSSKISSGSVHHINCSTLSQGSYTLTIEYNKTMVHRKFVKL